MKKLFAVILCVGLLLCGCEPAPETSLPEVSKDTSSNADVSFTPEISDVSDETSTYVPVNSFVKGETVTDGNWSYDFSPEAGQVEFDTLRNFINTLYASGKFEYPPFALENVVSGQYSGNASNVFSIAYMDLETGCMLTYDTGKTFQTCSVIKPSLAVQLLKSGYDLSTQIPITYYAGEEGALTPADVGKSFEADYLFEVMITHSDNTAYVHMLRNNGNTSQQAFADYLKALGCKALNVGTPNYFKYGLITPYDLAIMMQDIYEYSTVSEGGKRVLEYMQNTTYNELITSYDCGIPVAHKYGQSPNFESSLHDAAIYLGEHPYILVILSVSDYDEKETYDKFRAISLLVNEFHAAMHGGADLFPGAE